MPSPSFFWGVFRRRRSSFELGCSRFILDVLGLLVVGFLLVGFSMHLKMLLMGLEAGAGGQDILRPF